MQWQRIADAVEGGIEAARTTATLHSKALTQLDAAQFALSKIVADLSVVMSLPGMQKPARRRTVAASTVALAA